MRYQVKEGGVTWQALVPQSFAGDNAILGQTKTIGGLQGDGRVRIEGKR